VDEKRTDLKAALRELAAEESADIGPHVGMKRLIAYRQRTLPAAEREAVQDHLSLCRQCTGRLLELRDFEAASSRGDAAGPEPLQEEAWEALARRLPWQVSAVRPIAGAGRRQASQRAPRFVYGVAAALLLAVIGISVWAAVTARQERRRLALLEQRLDDREEALSAAQRSLAEAERQLAAARGHIQDLEKRPEQPAGRVAELESRIAKLTSDLEELRRTTMTPKTRDRIAAASPPIAVSVAPFFALRSQESPDFLRGGGAVNSVPMQGGRIGVKLALADHPVYDEYRIELSDREGQVLWTGHRPGSSLLGDAGTTVSIQGLGSGLYTLRIEGLHPDSTDLLAAYLLDVTRTAMPARD
jgi:hypothetical protein